MPCQGGNLPGRAWLRDEQQQQSSPGDFVLGGGARPGRVLQGGCAPALAATGLSTTRNSIIGSRLLQ